VRFVGLDLAWSPRNTSGAAVLDSRGAVVAHRADLRDDEEVLGFVSQAAPDDTPLLVAIDAPLRVPNATGSRPCDREVASTFGRFEAAPYPANRRTLARYGGLRAEAITDQLATFGFRHNPWLEARQPTRQVIEVFPHPATITLFGLDRTLKYKSRAGRNYATRRAELARLYNLLAGLQSAEPPLRLPADLQQLHSSALRGRAFKAAEDTLDAIVCAYAARYAWWHGPRGYAVYGLGMGDDPATTGHILVPMPPAAWERIKRPRILFLDRDGTLNESCGNRPPNSPREIQLLPGVHEILHHYASLGWRLVIVTNQGGVAFGYNSEPEAWDIHRAVLDALPVPVDATYLCPHHPQATEMRYRRDCPHRKPAPGALLDALSQYQARPQDCLCVGDQETDRQAAEAAGVPFVPANEFFGR
jgi:histidinol-phosphate phosphatase family protein